MRQVEISLPDCARTIRLFLKSSFACDGIDKGDHTAVHRLVKRGFVPERVVAHASDGARKLRCKAYFGREVMQTLCVMGTSSAQTTSKDDGIRHVRLDACLNSCLRPRQLATADAGIPHSWKALYQLG